MNIFGLLGLASFLRSMRPKYRPQTVIKPNLLKQEFNELSDEVDHYYNRFIEYRNRMK